MNGLSPTRQRALAEVRRLVWAGLAGRPARVMLFGSCATGEVNRFSDIDVAIDAGQPLPPGILSGINEALEESTVPYFVDVIDLATASPDLKARVAAEGISWND